MSVAQVQPTIPKRVEDYLSKCVGRDMALKSIVYTMRLATLYSAHDPKRMHLLQTMILNIIDCRMVFNHWKYIGTFRTCIRTLKESKNTLFVKLITALSFFFRTFEQFAGDMGYLQKNVFTDTWSRTRISWHYKFNKSMSLTCCAIVELWKVITLSEKATRMEANLKNARHGRTPSGNFLDGGILASPTDLGMIRRPSTPACEGGLKDWEIAKEYPKALNGDGVSPFETPLLFPNFKAAMAEVDQIRSQRNRSIMFFVRNICDMIVYYQWISWYNPWKHLEYLCGLTSGLMGVYLVWEDTAGPSGKGSNV